MFKILVTGAKGQVGKELIRLSPSCFSVVGLGSEELDITNQQQVSTIMKLHQPNLIINAAAYTAVDKAESDPEAAFSVNGSAVELLAKAANKANIPLFHVSTDYVFDGQAIEPYSETDLVNPKSIYGSSKLAGEKALVATHSKYIILRTSWVFSATGNNFVKSMLRLGKERNELLVVADQHGIPTSAASIADILWKLAGIYQQKGVLSWGVYNFTNSPACTWHDFAREIFQQAKITGLIEKLPKVNAISSNEYPTPVQRPLWSVLDCSKIENLLDQQVPLWESELTKVLKLLKIES